MSRSIRFIVLFMTLVMLLVSFGGCSSKVKNVADADEVNGTSSINHDESNERETTRETVDKALKVGIALANSDEFTATLTKNYEAEAQARGIDIVITNAAGDITTQMSNVESLIAQSPDVIVLRCIDGDIGDRLVEMVKEAGIYCIVDETKPENSLDYDLNIMGDQSTHGNIIGDYIQSYLDNHQDVTLYMLYINGGTSENIRKRMTGIFETCVSDRLILIGDELGEWNATKAQEITEAYLTSHPEVNVIACANDEMALAVIETLKSAGREDIMVYGVDGTSESVANAIKAGNMTGTSRNDTVIAVGLIYEASADLVAGKALTYKDEVNKQIDPKAYVLVEKDNVDDYIYSSNN